MDRERPGQNDAPATGCACQRAGAVEEDGGGRRAETTSHGRPRTGRTLRASFLAMAIYLALGDSISIDDYTGVHGGGAASQLARKLGLELVDLTRDGNTTQGVLADLAAAPVAADIVTLTAGGNDLLGGDL